ncbi:MAG: hypothetical protein Q9227_003202 [Pyrenula ochraceoflavens]
MADVESLDGGEDFEEIVGITTGPLLEESVVVVLEDERLVLEGLPEPVPAIVVVFVVGLTGEVTDPVFEGDAELGGLGLPEVTGEPVVVDTGGLEGGIPLDVVLAAVGLTVDVFELGPWLGPVVLLVADIAELNLESELIAVAGLADLVVVFEPEAMGEDLDRKLDVEIVETGVLGFPGVTVGVTLLE